MNNNNSHMKTIIKSIALVSVLLGAAACQQFKVDTQLTPEQAAANIRMECDALQAYTLSASGTEAASFKVSSNTPWTISRSNGADWVTVSPSSSASSALISDVTVSVEPYTGEVDRVALITLQGELIPAVQTITITQSRYGKLQVGPISQNYAAAGGDLSFTIKTNVAWQVMTDVEWLSFNVDKGEPDPNGDAIRIIATATPSSIVEREGTVTVVAGDEEESFEVVQRGRFEISEFSDPFPKTGGRKTIQIRSDFPWEIMADKDWVVLDKEAFDETVDELGKINKVQVTVVANDGAAREAAIKISAGGVVKTVTVLQEGKSM